MKIQLKAATAADAEFLYDLHRQGLRDCIDRQFGAWDEERRRASFMLKLDPSRRRLVMCDGKPIGALEVVALEDRIHLLYIVILPEFQGRGIGSELIRGVLNDAKRSGKPVTLGLLKENRDACRLYSRLGFYTSGESETKLFMRCDTTTDKTDDGD